MGKDFNPWEVMRRVALLGLEVQRAKELVVRADRLAPVVSATFGKLAKLTTAEALTQPFSLKAHVSDAELFALEQASEIIGLSEPYIDPDDLEEQEAKIREARARFEDAPEPARSFILEQFDIILRGLADYRIIGVRALQQAVGEAWGHTVAQPPELLAQPEAIEARTTIKDVWERVWRAVKWTTRAAIYANALASGLPTGEWILEHIPAVEAIADDVTDLLQIGSGSDAGRPD